MENNLNYKPINHPYDKSFRDVLDIKSEAVWLINEYLDTQNKITEDEIEKYNSSFISNTLSNLEADVVYKLKHKDIFFLIEHQTKIDYTMPLRILEYERAIIFSCLKDKNYKNSKYRFPAIIPIVYYTGESKWNVAIDLRSIQETYGTLHGEELSRYNIFDNNKFTDEELLSKKMLLTQLTLIERSKDKKEFEYNLNKIIEQINNLNINQYSQQKKNILINFIDKLFSQKIGKEETIKYINKLKETEGNQMERVFEMMAREDEKMIKLGEKRGEKRGKLEAAKNMLKENLPIELISRVTGLAVDTIKKLCI